MKNARYITRIMLAAAGILLYACGKTFLERPPLNVLQPQDLTSKDGIEGLLIGAYSALDGQQQDVAAIGGGGPWEAAPTNWIYGSVAGGDAHKGSDATDQPPINLIMTGQFDPSNGFFNTKWKVCFDGVVRVNNLLKLLPQAKGMSDAELANVRAQARFLRGHFYFELKKMFGQVPWVDETVEDYKQPNTEDIWPKIEADFQAAMDSLPETQAQVGRANKWAAAAYLAKAYVFQKKFQQAKPLFDQLVTQGKTSSGAKYNLVARFEDNFDPVKKNNEESVFAIQMTANNGSGQISSSNQGEMLNFPYNSPFGCCGFYQPSQELVNSYVTNPAGLPYLDDYNNHPVKNDMGILSKDPFTPDTDNTLDPRLDWTVGRRGIPYLDWGNHPGRNWVRDQNYAGPYAPKKNVYWQFNQDKYKDGNSWAPGSAINIVLIRFADVLLLAAETEAQLGNLSGAEAYVNRVRQRAASPQTIVYKYLNDSNPMGGFSNVPAARYRVAPYPAGYFSSKELALKAIYFERKLELAMEGHRYFDLVRWGIAAQALNAYFSYESKITNDLGGARFVPNRNEYYPIPQRQIDLSLKEGAPTLQQNKGY